MPDTSAPPTTIRINEQLIPLGPRETVLQAALRSGIPFPSGCRVGGCGSCKCRLAAGRVEERTDTGYLLTGEELEAGYILACQSVPRTDVHVEVDLSRATRTRAVAGRVVGQERLTHDTTHLTVELDEALPFRAGQFARLSFDVLPGVARPYSFTTPFQGDRRVSFFIRKVPGGALSTLVNEQRLLGAAVRVEGPEGDFGLRGGDGPLLMIAGGSGLGPLLAVLRDGLRHGVRRPVTLLFGAREEQDLYALGELEALREAWPAPFHFVPVLSAAPEQALWTGARGLVTEHLPQPIPSGTQAYLCGPPAMIDRAIETLLEAGVRREDVVFDRFTTGASGPSRVEGAPPPAETRAEAASALDYAKYALFHLVGLFSAAALLAGGWRITVGLFAVLAFYLLGDALSGDDARTPVFRRPAILTAQLWLALPLLGLIVLASVWSVSPGDPLGLGARLSALTGYDLLAARAATGLGVHVAGFVLTGLMIGMVGTIPAHELTHRTWDRGSMLVGRWLLAFSFDTTFAIEHVYGHHRYVSTTEDPATAPRGRNVYHHVVSSTLKSFASAWRIESARLAKRRLPRLSWHNVVLRGQLMSLALVAGAGWMGGPVAAAYFVACALWGKALLEIVNYMEHYGMVRNPERPVAPRHSWNTNRRLSSWSMFNLTRHSHHHAEGEVPYHDLRPYADAPMMIGGYLTTLVVAMIPPLWHHLMTPRVLAWDRDFANDEERALAARANAAASSR